tara:strand:+ start:665 stop:2641 length:1977 start_codon:yes stop_codon:yes gene_type:complete
MCGIYGCFHKNSFNYSIKEFINNLNLLKSRGPDHSGYLEIELKDNKLKLGQTRLSILDLSSNANQPMISSDGNLIIVYNGEIYNHLILRHQLNHSFKSTGDTETLLEYINKFGIDKTLKDAKGMFAFCIFNKQDNTLTLARDLAGEKPLYLNFNENFFTFSSTLEPILNLSKEKKTLNLFAIQQYLKFNYFPQPLTVFNSCFKLPQSSYMKIDLNKFRFKKYSDFNELIETSFISHQKWWTINNSNQYKDFEFNNIPKTIKKAENLIENSVNSKLISDVPIGLFLSGGIDSSLILSLLKNNHSKIKTFSIGYENADFDESVYAKKIANHFNSEHHEFICKKNDFLDLIDSIPLAFSEPFADSSQIPTMMISKLARKEVKVALGGDAGDELFGGYNRYLIANKYWHIINIIPTNYRNIIISLLLKMPINSLKIFFKILTFITQDKSKLEFNLKKVLSKMIKFQDSYSFYLSMTNEWTKEANLIDFEEHKNLEINSLFNKNYTIEESMMFADFKTYLPDDILCKIDRSSMHYGLETRTPFIDQDIVNFAHSLPLNFKIYKNISKWILKEILKKYLPEKLFLRPKKGFAIPIRYWLGNELKDWTESLLSKQTCDIHGLFNFDVINKYKNEHFSNHYNHEHKLWSIIQFNQWYIKNKNFISR